MSKKLQKLNLHDRLKKHAFEHAFLTTYNFGARFFEDYALENFKSLQDNGNVSVLLDEGEYQDLLKSAVEESESFPKHANLRYLLHPIRVPGVFHPKIFLFAGKRRGLLVVGSANFTEAGIGSNAEMVATFDYEEGKNEEALPLVQAALQFFEQLANRWPAEQLHSNLKSMLAEVPWLSKEAERTAQNSLPVLLSNLDVPLWDQMVSRLPGPATNVSVLSRFFDAQPGLADVALATTKAKKLILYTQNGITTLTKAWLGSTAFSKGQMGINLCRYTDEEHFQQLHGKAFAFTCGSQVMLAMGSANFTTSALRRTANNGNVEVLLCYPLLPTNKVSPEDWFDPEGTGVALRKPEQLQTATDNSDDAPSDRSDFGIRIAEVLVEEQWLKVTLSFGEPPSGVSCRLAQADRSPIYHTLKTTDDGTLRCQLTEADQKKLRSIPALVDLGILAAGNQWKPLSLPILVTNLQDIRTGGDLRRERQIREARESPQRFLNVLNALCSSDDEERLKQFLTYCDIPMDLPVRLLRKRASGESAPPDEAEALRIMGSRNLRHFEILHDAVMDFSKRHRRRLERHVESGMASGVPNFLHILLTIGNLLLSQIARVVVALEADRTIEMIPNRWSQIRNNLDAYYWELRELFKLTSVDYVNALLDSKASAKTDTAFRESMAELLGLLRQATQQRDNLAAVQKTRLVVVTSAKRITGPGFFKSILATENWTDFAKELQKFGSDLQQRFAA
jgi:hypothetical protein